MGGVKPTTQTGATAPNQVDQTTTRGVDGVEGEMLGAAWTVDDGVGVEHNADTVSTGRVDDDAC